jgi:hypothetical protein
VGAAVTSVRIQTKLRAVHVPDRLGRKAVTSRSRCMNGSYPLSPSVETTVQGKKDDPCFEPFIHPGSAHRRLVHNAVWQLGSIFSRLARATSGSSRRKTFWPFSSCCCASLEENSRLIFCNLVRRRNRQMACASMPGQATRNKGAGWWATKQRGRPSGRLREFFSFDDVVTSFSDFLLAVPQSLERWSPSGFDETTQLGR